MALINERKAALEVLTRYFHKNNSFDEQLENFSAKVLNKGEFRALTTGTVKYKLLLDFYMSKLAKINSKTDIYAINTLRLGIYELIFTKNPPYSVINSYVELMKSSNKALSPFVNAVLRNFTRKKSSLDEIIKNLPTSERISTLYSHPEFMVKEWLIAYGEEETIKICRFNNAPPKISLRINTLKTDLENFSKVLTENNINFSLSKVKNLITLDKSLDIRVIPGFEEGHFVVQGEGSALVSHALNPKENEEILDLCAAPGGKTIHIAELIKNNGRITAVDISERRIKRIKENAQRLCFDCVETHCSDAIKFKSEQKYDKILVDAPCSNTGVLSKRADARWNRKPEDIVALSVLQLNILNNAAKYLKPEGVMVYSTCSIEKAENEKVVALFLQQNNDFQIEDLSPYVIFPTQDKMLTILQSTNNTDGFFIARLKKMPDVN